MHEENQRTFLCQPGYLIWPRQLFTHDHLEFSFHDLSIALSPIFNFILISYEVSVDLIRPGSHDGVLCVPSVHSLFSLLGQLLESPTMILRLILFVAGGIRPRRVGFLSIKDSVDDFLRRTLRPAKPAVQGRMVD